MKNKFRIMAIVALMLFVNATVINAQYARVNNRMSYPGQCLNIPGLTDVQKEKIVAVNDEHRKTIDNMRAEFYAAEDVITANNVKAKMTLEQNNHLKKISEVLNEEQLKFFNENIIAGPAGGRGRAYNVAGQADRGNGYGYYNTGGRGRGPCGMGYGRGFGRGMGYRNFRGSW